MGSTKGALLEMEHMLKRYDAAKWTIVTYLPFLWLPATHMFLKPEVTGRGTRFLPSTPAASGMPQCCPGVHPGALALNHDALSRPDALLQSRH
jgi:hypothetical protein